MTIHFDQNEQFILKIYSYKKFFKQGSVYFVLRLQDRLRISVPSLFNYMQYV